ncbi:MAG: hypothetical protein FWB76_05275 [Oscillospiraceae bacterium]|nr:hypothetical protein [Oscillospiraceae bacterium]
MHDPILTLHAAQDYATHRAFLQAKQRGWPFALAGMLALGAMGLTGGILLNELRMTLYSAAFLLLVICSSAWSLIRKPQERKLYQQLEENPASETFVFFHDRIEYTGQSKTAPHIAATWQYDYFASAWEFPTFFTLNNPNGSISLFAKDAMSDHEQETFRALLDEKYGKKFTERTHVPKQV